MALIDLSKPDPQRNRRNGFIMAFIMVLYLALVIKCAGQCEIRTKPYLSYPNVTRIQPCNGISYEANEKAIFVGIYADSIKNTKYVPILYVLIPKNLKIKNPDLLITFEDGYIPELIPQINDSTGDYIEFSCKDPYFSKLKTDKINIIHFINNEISYYVYEEKIDLFYEFMKRL